MNLPASAVEFLDVFKGCLNEQRWQEHPLPVIHCYTFAKADDSSAGGLTYQAVWHNQLPRRQCILQAVALKQRRRASPEPWVMPFRNNALDCWEADDSYQGLVPT